MKYSFCETITAGADSPWHIRPLTDKGQKLGGGADTKALCGREVSWDIRLGVDPEMSHCCRKCRDEYLKRTVFNG
jgi:hypothetical protein